MVNVQMLAFLVSVLCGFLIVLSVLIKHQRSTSVSKPLLYAAVVLIALPVASTIKLGPDGIEVQIRDQLAVIKAELTQVDKPVAAAAPDKIVATTLIFYQDRAFDSAESLFGLLKDQGVPVSLTPSDFTELGLKRLSYSQKDAYIVYLPHHEEDAQKIKEMMEAMMLFKQIKFKQATSLSVNAIQIGLF